jgi:PAS domain S-box-containing protein
LEFVRRFGYFLDRISSLLALARTLRGTTAKLGSLDDGRFTERSFEERATGEPSRAFLECYYWIRKLQARFFAGDYLSATDAAEKVETWYAACASLSFFLLEKAEFHFYAALSRAALCEPIGPDSYAKHREVLGRHEQQLRAWAVNCPPNFEDRAALVSAEIARIEGRPLDAMNLYERAIASARANGFVHNEALAYELAARFYAARGFEEVADLYLGNARRCYLRWGADGKVRQLDQLHPQLRQHGRGPTPPGTIEAPVERLDLATVIEVAQALSGELVLDKLIDRLMRAVIQHAGAERGVLITLQSEELRIEAEATTRGEDVIVQLRDGAPIEAVLPESLIRYAMRTRETLILDDASSQNPFTADPYIIQHRARSLLCLALINRGKFIGILYLENNMTPRVFTPDRITVLKVLASQAAISLENTRLYRDVEDREGKIRRLVDANIIGIFVADIGGPIVEANDAFLRIVGYDREDLALSRVSRRVLTPPEWRERDMHALAELTTTGTFQPFEKEYFRKDGSRVPVLVGGTLFKKGGNEAVAFVLDLTERKRAEEALRESERSLRSAIDGIPGFVGVLAANGDLEAVNRQIVEYCGRSLDELKNWGTNGTVHHEDLAHVAEVFASSIASGIPYQIEQRLRRFDGKYRWFDNRGVPIRDDSGRIARWYVLLTDIEDRTRALARLQQMQSDFAHMNRVSIMGELAASLSHEIAQPVGSARNNARAAQNFLDMQPPHLGKVREALSSVVGNADRAGDIIDRIREQIKKAPPRKERFDLNAAINEVIGLAQNVVIRNGVSVQTRLADGLFPIHGDRVQLQQVILNLILNAVEAMGSVEAGARDLLISTEQDLTGVLVAVRDSGPGIDPEHLGRVFEAFYTTKSSGVGMGLSICRSIIDAHGGRLWAEANEPRGAVFQFTLPGAEVS